MAEYIPGDLEMKFQGMLEDIDIREKKKHILPKQIWKIEFSNIADK